MTKPQNSIHIGIKIDYLEAESQPKESRFVYAYTITIENQGDLAAQLMSRYWKITDANESVQEVEGLGVVGEQPTLLPGQRYEYTSGAVLETETGIMEGEYTMLDEHGEEFKAPIPSFALVRQSALH